MRSASVALIQKNTRDIAINAAKQNGDGTDHQPVDLPDLRSLGARPFVILVADDDDLIRHVVTLLMQREGHFVLSAADGQEGLERSRQYAGSIDLLITDVKMPRLNGTDLCAHLLEERPGIKVLVMSSAAIRKLVNKNVNLPFLPKPFEAQTLKATVRKLLALPVQHSSRHPPRHPQVLTSTPDGVTL
jgi:CheY-like chemotaxis protein